MHKKNKGLYILGIAAALTASSFGTVPNVQAKQNSDSSSVGIADKVGEYVKEDTKEDAVSELTAGKVTKQDVEKEVKEKKNNSKDKKESSTTEKPSKNKKKSGKKASVDAEKYPQFQGRAVVKADGKVNIRAKASKNSEVVGSLENGGICLVDKIGKTWTKVESGSCVGYIKNEFLLYGDDAGEWSDNNGVNRYATVKTPTLKVRASKDENSDCITLIPEGEEYYVLSSSDGWIEVEIDEESGFVRSDYVDVRYENPRAVSVAEQEEADRKAKEEADQAWLAYLAEQEAATIQSTDVQSDKNEETTPSMTEENALKAEGNLSTSTDASPAAAPVSEPVTEPETPVNEPATEPTTEPTTEAPADNSETTTEAPADNSEPTTETPAETPSETPEESTTQEPATEEPTTEEPTTSAPAAPAGQSGVDLANYACQFIGYPYHYGGTSLTGGADCSGFVLSIYALWGYSLPHDAELQANYGTEVSLSDLQPGDLLFYPSGGYAIGHVAIYIGDGMIVHASNERDGIKTSVYNYKTPVKATRLLGQ